MSWAKLLQFPLRRPVATRPLDSLCHRSDAGRRSSLTMVNFAASSLPQPAAPRFYRGNDRGDCLSEYGPFLNQTPV